MLDYDSSGDDEHRLGRKRAPLGVMDKPDLCKDSL